jgi:VWFA-related protein
VRLTALFVLLAGGVMLARQNPPPPAGQIPTFKLSVENVEVDAFVADRDGNFVRDLKQSDFEVFEDGKPQAITTFALIDIPSNRPSPFAVGPVEPDVRSNEQAFNGRIYVMVVDDLHTGFGRTGRVRTAARQFVEQHLGAGDLMAVVHTAGPGEGNQEFTGNRRLLVEAVERTFGRKLDSATITRNQESLRLQNMRGTGVSATDITEMERASDARRSLDTLRDVAGWFARVQGRRKAILFVSEGIDYDITNWADNPSASSIIASMRDAVAAAARGNVAIYGIDPRGLTSFSDGTMQVASVPDDTTLGLDSSALREELVLAQNSLRELSDETGGFAVVSANDFSNAFDRIVRDNSSYYVLAYDPPGGKVGSAHKIDVRVRRPGLTVRARQGYVTAKALNVADAGSSAKSMLSDPRKVLTPDVLDALDSPIPVNGLVLSVFAAPFKGTAPDASVLVGVEMRGRDLRLDARNRLTMAFAAVDAGGKIRGGNTDAVLFANVSAETKDRVAQSGLRMLNRVDLAPGRYQLRVAAQDPARGTVGSVWYDLDVPDFTKSPLSMSGIAITSAAASGQPTVHPDEALRQVLPAPPVGARVFPQNDQIALFAEVYDNDASRPHKVDIAATVTSEGGLIVFKANETRDSSEIQGRRGGYGFATRIAMRDLSPGSYLLTVSAASRLGGAPAVQRQVPFSVTPPRPVPLR